MLIIWFSISQHFIGAKVTLSETFISVFEELATVAVCVELKSPIKRDISLQLSHHNLTAGGRVFLRLKNYR